MHRSIPRRTGSPSALGARIMASAEKVRDGDIDGGLKIFFDGIEGDGAWARLPAAPKQQLRDNAFTLIGQVGENRQPYRQGRRGIDPDADAVHRRRRHQGRAAAVHRALAPHVPGSRTAMIPGAGHWMFEQAPQEFCRVVLEFLASGVKRGLSALRHARVGKPRPRCYSSHNKRTGFAPRTRGGTAMKLTQQQIDDFNREGWLFLPELFSAEEVDLLAREAEGIYDTKRPEVWREKSGAPRTAFAAHLYNEAFGLLGAHPRMIEPVEQIFGEKVYMHQYKINAKSAFTGDVWQWHQDYGTWKRDDGMPQPRAMNIAIFLDEVMPINGPLMLVPRSQHAGDLKASHDLATTSYPLWTLDEETVTRLVKEGGIVAPTGKAGGMLMFHGNLVHGSAGNITPYPRKIVYLTLNAVSNYIRTPTRPEYIAHRDFTPIQTVDDDALLRLARAHRQAAE